MSHYSFSDKLLGVAAASNGKIYAIGGHNGNILSTVEEYDPATDTWTTRASMPTARYLLGVAAASNGKIYAIGGTLATVEEYDPATDTWTSRASMPTARGYLGVTAASNGKIYAIGGSVGMSPLATVEEYDPATDTWTTRASMPTARYGLGVAAASNGKIYAIGGPGPFVEEYDPATDTWTTRASMPTAQSALGVVAASNGKIYAIGGENGGGPLATVEEYDPAIDTWTTRTSMLTPMNNLGVAAANNGKIYAIGGTTVEEFTLPFVFNSSYNMEWLAPIVYSLDFDVTSLASRGIYTVTVYGAFDADGLEIAPNTAFTFTVDYAGFISDITPPLRSAVTASGDGSLSNLSASWISSDPESPIMMYRYAIGTTPGGRDVVNWNYISNTTTSMTRTGLNLTYGQVYYVTVGARNEGGLWSEDGASNGIIAGVAPPASFNKDTPANGATGITTSPTLSWTASTGATSYEYCYDITNDNACDSSWTSSGTATSANLSDLNINTTYYWHVRAI
ncbi:MAG: hypothetical protein KKD28_11655, partial [Chloroflexi bacterium]|nr:hypothetical protein [Chloroflexota bacterium]